MTHATLHPIDRLVRQVRRGPNNSVPPETRAQIVAMYCSGVGARKVAKHFGVSAPSVLAFVRAAGQVVREPFYRATRSAAA